ncbi:MAG: phosphotransferase [Betaproteobacteria bacterium]|nr:phosphotransferase [Betaproteobacteria bacterium]
MRLQLLGEWLTARFGAASFSLSPASEDASFRRYFRISAGDRSWIAMDAPPEREDCRPFVKVAEVMRAAGIHVPEILAQDLEHGFLLLTDLGTTSYLGALDPETADPLFRDAIDALIRLQRASQPGVLPPYDAALLRREVDLFPQWYVARHLGVTLSAEERETFDKVTATILANNLSQPRVYVHRDYMPRNLMVSDPNPGVLDFQDAVFGPITYDVASLFKDAFVSWEEERVLDWTVRYWERARRASLPVDTDFGAFYRDFEWMGLQRHLKVMGIFARIRHRDGKSGYVEDTPRFARYARGVCARYAQLMPLLALLDRLENRRASAGYTF